MYSRLGPVAQSISVGIASYWIYSLSLPLSLSQAIQDLNESLLKMAKRFSATLYCLAVIISPVVTATSQEYSPDACTRTLSSSSMTSSTAYTTKSPSASSSPTTFSTSLPSSYTLVTTAEPTDAPWSVSYSDYTSLASTSSPAASASPSGVRFQPDGASPGFFCEYPTLSEWQPCNAEDSRDCWLRNTKKSQLKERCNCTDDEPDEININTDCTSEFLLQHSASC